MFSKSQKCWQDEQETPDRASNVRIAQIIAKHKHARIDRPCQADLPSRLLEINPSAHDMDVPCAMDPGPDPGSWLLDAMRGASALGLTGCRYRLF